MGKSGFHFMRLMVNHFQVPSPFPFLVYLDMDFFQVPMGKSLPWRLLWDTSPRSRCSPPTRLASLAATRSPFAMARGWRLAMSAASAASAMRWAQHRRPAAGCEGGRGIGSARAFFGG